MFKKYTMELGITSQKYPITNLKLLMTGLISEKEYASTNIFKDIVFVSGKPVFILGDR